MITRYISARKLADLEGGQLIVRLMLFMNDLSALDYFDLLLRQVQETPLNLAFIDGAGFHLFRLACSVIREALKLMEELNADKTIQRYLANNKSAQDALSRLLEFGPSKQLKSKCKEFELIKRIRDIGTFHGIDKDKIRFVDESLQRLKSIDHVGTFEMSSGIDGYVRFKLADELYRSMFVHEILKVEFESVTPTAEEQIALMEKAYKETSEFLVELKKDIYLVTSTIILNAAKECSL